MQDNIAKRTFLTAEWRKLILLNYAVDPAILSPYVPYKTELDYFNGKCYVSLVGFRFLNTRLRGIPVPFHKNFEEINLRFYVRYKDGDQWKRGVTFIKEIVPMPALAIVANRVYGEKYVTMPTAYQWMNAGDSIVVDYSWKHAGAWDKMQVTALDEPLSFAPASEAEFITEHYWGYTPIGDKLSSEYEVVHPSWKMYEVTDHTLSVRFGELYGAEFGFLKDVLPDSVMLAEGSNVSVRRAGKLS